MDSLKITGRLKVTKRNLDGSETVNYYTNNVMFNGKMLIAKYIANQKPMAVTHMAMGTDETPVDQYQTALFEEVYRKAIHSSVSEANIAVIDCMFGEGEAVGSLREAALFTSDGVMFARALINEEKDVLQELTIAWELTIN